MRPLSLALIPLLSIAWLGCGDPSITDVPRIVVRPTTLVFNSVPLGGEDRNELLIENEGEAVLRVSETRVETNSGFVRLADNAVPTFELEPGQAHLIPVVFSPSAPAPTEGRVVFRTNDPQSPSLAVEISTPTLRPEPSVIPAVLDFGVVGVGATETIDVALRDIGFAPLIVCDADVSGSPDIGSNLSEVLADAQDSAVGYPVADVFDFPTGIGAELIAFEITYTPSAPGGDTAELFIDYDVVGDPENPCDDANRVVARYEINGTGGTPLLGRDPCPLDFSERAIDVAHEEPVTLTNLGALNLELYDIRLDDVRTADTFSLDVVPQLPLTLEPDDATAFSVEYLPTELQVSTGVVLIEHSDATGERTTSECRLSGVGVDNACPIAVPNGWILEDPQNRRGTTIDWALPLQTLVLDGSASYDPAGEAVVDYFWTVTEAPDAVVNGLRPFSGDPENPAMAEFFLPLAGRYEVCLGVVDSSGLSCEEACVTVSAIPDEAIAIELTWDNPDDPDQSDTEGADVDLHFVKMPNAWFNTPFDTYFGNVAPNWTPETPSLDRDDEDGVGPETIQMDNPESCQWYAVGVHYFRAAFGTAWPNVKIYINGRVVDEIVNQPLRETDTFWDVARVHWPSGTILRVNTVMEGFDSDEGIAPPVTDAMRASGLCGTE